MNSLKDTNIHLENKHISREFFAYLFVMYAFVFMTKNCFSSAMAAIVNEGTFTKSQTGLFTAAFYAVYAPLQVVGGVAVDKHSPEKLLMFGLVGSAFSNAV